MFEQTSKIIERRCLGLISLMPASTTRVKFILYLESTHFTTLSSILRSSDEVFDRVVFQFVRREHFLI